MYFRKIKPLQIINLQRMFLSLKSTPSLFGDGCFPCVPQSYESHLNKPHQVRARLNGFLSGRTAEGKPRYSTSIPELSDLHMPGKRTRPSSTDRYEDHNAAGGGDGETTSQQGDTNAHLR